MQTVNVGTLTSLSPHGDDTAGAGKNLNVSKSLAARKSTVRNKKGFTGVAKSCRMLAERGSVVEDDLNITYENRGQADGFAKTNSNGQQQEKKRESYRGVSYFLNRQDELDPDLLSDPAPIVDEYNLPRGAATIDTKYLIQDTSESEFNGSVEHGGKLQISFNDAAVNRLHDPTEWDPMDDSDDASRQVINHKSECVLKSTSSHCLFMTLLLCIQHMNAHFCTCFSLRCNLQKQKQENSKLHAT